ncbi:MAG: hypothetical protein RDV48_08415 [Candidatus Eremiobacteraeota bacterium]|nr:hypothetical protein [Candidatus Eremiobacteraeota bacterium]
MMKRDFKSDSELKTIGIEVLNQALGPSAALRFLTLLQREPTDYIEISQRLYKAHTLDEIFDCGKKEWLES